jgi:hypothetical protein
VLSNNGRTQRGTYQQLKNHPVMKEFEIEYVKNSDNVVNTKDEITALMDVKEEKKTRIKSNPKYFFKFYGLVNFCAGPIILFFLVLPPLLDLYYEVIVAQTFQSEEHYE